VNAYRERVCANIGRENRVRLDRTIRPLSLFAVVVMGVAACSAPAAITTAPPTAGPAASTPGSSSVATAAAATAGPAQTQSGPRVPTVDLTFSGTVNFVAQGSKGTCQIGKASDGTYVFGFFMTEADFPGLGDSFQITESPGTHTVDMKWLTPGGAVPFFGIMSETGVTFSPDHHAITLDADLPPSGDFTEHIKGSITCPV
jgi:hypothetical protein